MSEVSDKNKKKKEVKEPTKEEEDQADACVCEAVELLARNDVAGGVEALRAALAACADAVAALLLLRMVCMCDPAQSAAAGASPDVLQRRIDRAPDARYVRAEALLTAHADAPPTGTGRVWAVLRGAWLSGVRGQPAAALACYSAAASAGADDWTAELVRSIACTNAAAVLEKILSSSSATSSSATEEEKKNDVNTLEEISQFLPADAPSPAVAAARWYDMGAAHGNRVAELNVALQQLDGVPGVRAADEGAAVRTLARLAAAGLAPAQVHYAWCLAQGAGSAAPDAAGAAAWLRRAAEQRHVPAMRRLGECLRDGRGVARDDAEAAQWLRRAAKRGDARALVALAALFHARRVPGVPDGDCDYEAAVALQCAAAQGDARAAYELALCHAHGRGVPCCARTAAALLTDAARAGLAAAQTSLGLCYARGIGVDRDPAAAALWLARAARLNEPTALRFLAENGATLPSPSHPPPATL